MEKQLFDVAISFLVADQEIAASLKAKLTGLNVFFYPHNQEELIGTDGIESMRAPFLDARVNVVLFRERYGNTPWTGIELAAIKDSCLNTGFRSLIFVQLDKKDKKPTWLPDTHIRCILGDFTLDEVAGAIKSKVQENGGLIQKADARSEAFRVKQEADYYADRDRLMRDHQWIGDLHRTIAQAIEEMGRIVSELNETQKLNIVFGSKQHTATMRTGFVSVVVGYQQPITNCVGDQGSTECHVWVSEHSGHMPLPGERLWYVEGPKRLKLHKLKVDVGQDRTPVFRAHGTEEVIRASELADYVVRIFLDLVSRANRGKVEPPHL
jgi:hypothetical protein